MDLQKFQQHFILDEISLRHVDSLSECDADCEGKKATKTSLETYLSLDIYARDMLSKVFG